MLIAFSGNAIFGFSFLFSKLALNVAEPFVLLAVRFFVAFLLMSLLRALKVVPCNLKGKNLLPVIILGFLQPVIYFICESYGIKYTSSSFAGIIIALIPIAGLFFAGVMLKEKPTFLQVVFSMLGVAGVMVMTLVDELGAFQWKGLILLLGAVVSAALFSIQSRHIADRFTSFERTYVMFAVGTVTFFILCIMRIGGDYNLLLVPIKNGQFWISIAYLAGASSVGAYLMLNKALDVLPVARSLVFANVTTVISVLAGVLLLKEQFTLIQAVGIAMVIVGVYGVNRFTGKSGD